MSEVQHRKLHRSSRIALTFKVMGQVASLSKHGYSLSKHGGVRLYLIPYSLWRNVEVDDDDSPDDLELD